MTSWKRALVAATSSKYRQEHHVKKNPTTRAWAEFSPGARTSHTALSRLHFLPGVTEAPQFTSAPVRVGPCRPIAGPWTPCQSPRAAVLPLLDPPMFDNAIPISSHRRFPPQDTTNLRTCTHDRLSCRREPCFLQIGPCMGLFRFWLGDRRLSGMLYCNRLVWLRFYNAAGFLWGRVAFSKDHSTENLNGCHASTVPRIRHHFHTSRSSRNPTPFRFNVIWSIQIPKAGITVNALGLARTNFCSGMRSRWRDIFDQDVGVDKNRRLFRILVLRAFAFSDPFLLA